MTPTPPGADVLGAHGALAAFERSVPHAELDEVLAALLLGAGVDRGLALDPACPGVRAVRGLALTAESLGVFEEAFAFHPSGLPPDDVLHALLSGVSPPVLDPRAIPITAGDELLLVLVLAGPPLDPVGFASVVAHAAALLSRQRMADRVRQSEFELKYRVWELESIYDVGLSIARTLDLDSLADEILMKSVSLLNARNGTLVIRDVDGEGVVLVKDFGAPVLPEAAALSIPDEGFRVSRGSERDEILRGSTAQTLLGVPIRLDGKPFGALLVADKENRAGGIEEFNAADERLLKLFGNQAAIAIENARLHREALEKERIEREIELAAAIQKTILPDSIPEVKGLALAGGNRPTRQVGGDYFDVISLPGDKTAFCVADVSGKGVPAALLVSTVHACLHLLVESHDGCPDLKELVSRVNRHLVRFSSTRKFVTLFLALFDPRTREIVYVNAGHNPGLHATNGGIRLLPSGGLPIGMLPNVTHNASRIEAKSGDLVVLYSDGITEAQSLTDEEFGMERLTRIVEEGRDATPEAITAEIFRAVAEFTAGTPQYDDQTVLVARVQ